jgi:hypothetical protein
MRITLISYPSGFKVVAVKYGINFYCAGRDIPVRPYDISAHLNVQNAEQSATSIPG